MPDWLHIAMGLQHLKQTASALSADDPALVAAKAVIAEEVERLHWRLWNGKRRMRKSASIVLARSCIIFRAERWTKVHHTVANVMDRLARAGWLSGRQSDWLVNYTARYRAGLRVGSAITEGTANFLVNRRMNKSQPVRRSRGGADLLLQVRCAVCNGWPGSGF
jgi:hypothetical protein